VLETLVVPGSQDMDVRNKQEVSYLQAEGLQHTSFE
jgi:hypothetical protein